MEKTKKQQLVEKVAMLKKARQQIAKPDKPVKKVKTTSQKADIDHEAIIRNIDDIGSQPKSRHEFEKLVLTMPNDVEQWIKYVTFVYESEVVIY